MTEKSRKLNNSRQDRTGLLGVLRKNIVMRALLAIVTVVLTVIVLFSLTVAWFTNVVQTGGLHFQTEQWEFDGEITIHQQNIVMSPGDSGVIPLTVENEGKHIVAASVSVSKDSMTTNAELTEMMKKRLYFYVDTTATRNDESMDRVYVSDKNSYTYTILPESKLMLTEASHNAPLLKWEWVYDVLGYYVVGQSVEATGEVNISEYIRPIVYDYDETKTTFNSDSSLATIDGSKTALAFLKEITATDGYAGAIDENTVPTGRGYYPISVDANGYGVWLHLCTYTEIQQNIADDTTIGQMQNAPACQVTIKISGSNSREEQTHVKSEAELISALKNPTAGIVTLSDDVALTAPIALGAGTNAILDLNGKTLSTTASQIFSLQSGANLSVSNGNLSGSIDNKTAAVYAEGAYVTMKNVNISNVYQGFSIKDHLVDGSSSVRISGSVIEASYNGIHLYGNADASGSRTEIVVENSTVKGEGYAGICCNGSYRATDITVKNSTITGYWTAIYHPQKQSTMTITNSTLTGYTGLVVKGGTVTVENSTVTATPDAAHNAPAYNNSGFSDTADGIYLEGGYDADAVIYINGSSVVTSSGADGSLAVRHYAEDGTPVAIHITGGSYNSDVKDYCVDGYQVIANGNGTYTVAQETTQ